MRKKLFILMFFVGVSLQSQNSRRTVDSLLKVLPGAKNDTVRVRIYFNLLNNLKESDNKKALFYGNEGFQLVKKMKWDKGYAVYYNDIGNNYLDQSMHSKALEYYLLSLNYSEKFPIIRERTYENITTVYIKESNLSYAIKYNKLAESIAKKEHLNLAIANCLLNYALIFEAQKNFIKAKDYYLKSFGIFKSENDLSKMASVLSHLGDISEDFNLKSGYYLQSKILWDKVDPTYVLAISNLLGIAEINIEYIKKNQENSSRTERSKMIYETENYLNDAILYSKQGNIQQNLMYAYGKLSELKELQGDYKASLKYINMNFEIYEKVFSQENKNKIAALESKQELTQRDKEIAVKKIIILQNEKQKTYLVLAVLFFGVAGGIFYHQSNNRKRNNRKLQLLNSELDTANATKIKFFSILNHDLKNPVSNFIDLIHIQQEAPELLDAESKKRMENKTLLSAENLLMSMEDILQWSKSQMENYRPQPKIIFISSLFNDVQNHFSSEEKIKINYENPENIKINTDENYLKTIIRNLTGNAIKALDEIEKPIITWKVWQDDTNIFLSITDNGKGALKEEFKALYDEKEIVGIKTGLGLHLIRDLAKPIDCDIKVASKLNEGTSIVLSLKKGF